MSTRSPGNVGETSQTEITRSGTPSLLRTWLPIFVSVTVIVGAGLWFGGLMRSRSGAERQSAPAAAFAKAAPPNQQLPAFISGGTPRVQEAYSYAAAHGDEMTYMPCYCGCGEHSGHRWVRDCFVKEWAASGITYDPHGSGCDICVSIALDVKNGLESGQSLAAVRKAIDAKYAKYGAGTNTPLPPG